MIRGEPLGKSRELSADGTVIPHLILLFSVLDGDRPF
ncbi:hypothetical protein WP2S18C03_14950 [Aeromonas veronii]|nr:hypothetical protein WP2S18C03_14950 [Aeromonas veronii]